jgi:hypothetical protein
MCYKAGVGFGGNFIFGDPAETPQTVKETMTFFRERCVESKRDVLGERGDALRYETPSWM